MARSDGLPAVAEPFAEEAIELGHGEDFLGGGLPRIFDAAELDQLVVLDHVAGPRIAIARLAHRADVHHELAVAVGEARLPISLGREEPAVLGEHAGNVRVPLKANRSIMLKSFSSLRVLKTSSGNTYSVIGSRAGRGRTAIWSSRMMRGSSARKSQRA